MAEKEIYMPQQETGAEQFTPAEINSKEDLTQFWLVYRRNNGLAVENTNVEQRLAEIQAKKTIAEMACDKSLHFFAARDAHTMVGTGALQIWIDDGNNTKYGRLSLLTVDPPYRGKNIAKLMTDTRTAAAKDLGCTWVDTQVFVENPTGLVTKFNDGYILKEIDGSAFVLYKKIDGDSEYDSKKIKPLQEIQLIDLATIEKLLKKGWVGIDIKNSGDEKDNDPKLWILIIEKQ